MEYQSSNEPQLIDLRNLVKNYWIGGGEVNVLKEINLTIGSGEFVSVMRWSGPSMRSLV